MYLNFIVSSHHNKNIPLNTLHFLAVFLPIISVVMCFVLQKWWCTCTVNDKTGYWCEFIRKTNQRTSKGNPGQETSCNVTFIWLFSYMHFPFQQKHFSSSFNLQQFCVIIDRMQADKTRQRLECNQLIQLSLFFHS